MKEERNRDLRKRTREFALRIIRLYSALPKSKPAQVIGNQLLRCGTSVGANYSEALRSRSDAEFISKHELCLQELEETTYWIDLLIEAEVMKQARISPLREEADELIAVFTAIAMRTKRRMKSS